MEEFRKELEQVINKHSQENASNTPDFILAEFLKDCLCAWNKAVQMRETWYGRDGRPSFLKDTQSKPKEVGVEELEKIINEHCRQIVDKGKVMLVYGGLAQAIHDRIYGEGKE